MTRKPNYAYVSAGQKVLWKAELRSLMEADVVLAGHVPMLDTALFFSKDLHSHGALVEGQPQLIAYRDPVLSKFVVVIFELLKQHDEIGGTVIEHAMIEITLYAQVSHFNDEPFVNWVVSPKASAPVVFLTHTTGCGSSKLVTTTVGLNDLLDHFPGQTENVLTQMAFVIGVMQDAQTLIKQNGGAL
jgi:hypothetical protein